MFTPDWPTTPPVLVPPVLIPPPVEPPCPDDDDDDDDGECPPEEPPVDAPEPGILFLLAIGAGAVWWHRRKALRAS